MMALFMASSNYLWYFPEESSNGAVKIGLGTSRVCRAKESAPDVRVSPATVSFNPEIATISPALS